MMRFGTPGLSFSPEARLPNRDVRYLEDRLLDHRGELTLQPAKVYKSIPMVDLRVFCHYQALYCLPTIELIDWLKREIRGRTAIEIGAGRCNMGRWLEIPSTDSFLSIRNPEVAAHCLQNGQQPILPSHDVEELAALAAVEKYRPQVVIGSWITQLYDPRWPDRGGNMYGVDEERMLDLLEHYILVGNDQVHGPQYKTIQRSPHRTFRAPWLVSRTARPELNRVYVWPGRKQS